MVEVQARRRVQDASAVQERKAEEEEGGGRRRRAFPTAQPPLSWLRDLAHISPQIRSKRAQTDHSFHSGPGAKMCPCSSKDEDLAALTPPEPAANDI